MNTETHEGSVEDAGIAGASIVVKTDVLPPQSDSEYCDTMVALDQSHGDASVGLTHEECMKTIADERSQGGGITVGSTTTDENGAYELTLISDIDTYTITAQNGTNMVTGEPNDSTFTVSSKVSYHVNPASELASDLIEEGMSVEEAKDKVIEFVNSDLSNVASLGEATEPLSKEDLFDRSMTKDMESQNRKGAMKAVVFNTLNNIKEMLVEAVEADAPSAEEVEKEVRKAIAKELRLINHKEGQNVNISNLVESAIDRVGEEIELVELKEVSKKSIIGSTINSQSHELTSIDLGDGNVYRSIAAVETKRHEIKDEKSMVEQLVKIDVSVESDDESKLSVLKNIKSAKKEEIEEERKSKEPVNFDSKLDKIKERLELQDQIFDLIEEAGDQIAYVRGITKYDEKEFLSMLKGADSISAEFDELKSEIKERNDIEDLGFDEGKFEKVQSAIDELYTVLKKQQQLLSEVPTLEPIDGGPINVVRPIDGEPIDGGPINVVRPIDGEPINVPKDPYKKMDMNNIPQSHLDVRVYFDALKVEIKTPETSEDVDDVIEDLGSTLEPKFELFYNWFESNKFETEEEFYHFIDTLGRIWNYQILQPMHQNGEDTSIVENEYMIVDNITGYFKEWYSSYYFNNSMPSLKRILDALHYQNSQADNQINNNKNNYKNNLTNHYYQRNIGQYLFYKWIYGKLYTTIQSKYNNLLGNISNQNHPNGGSYYAVPLSLFNVESVGETTGDITLSIEKSIDDYKLSQNSKEGTLLLESEGFVYILDSEHIKQMVTDDLSGKTTITIKIVDGVRESASHMSTHLPGVVLKDGDWSSNYNEGARQRVLFIGESCDKTYTLEPIRINSTSCCYQSNMNIYEKSISEYPSMFVGNITNGEVRAISSLNNYTFRGNGVFNDVETFVSETSYLPHHYEQHYHIDIHNNNNYDRLDGYHVNGEYLDKCIDYTLIEGSYGYYKTATSTGVNRDELSNPLYFKYDFEFGNHLIYDLVDGKYVPYTGLMYRESNYSGFNTQRMLEQNAQAEVRLCIGGVYFEGSHKQFGLESYTRGYLDCSGDTRSNIFTLQSYHMIGSNYIQHKGLEGLEVVWKSVDGSELQRHTFASGEYNPFKVVMSNTIDSNSQYFVEVTFGEEGELICQFTTKMKSWGLGRFGQPDANGKFNYQYYNCVDSDGDGFYDLIDFDPQDPNIYADYDLDGISDSVDAFPFSPGTLYSIVRNVENDELMAINANFSDKEFFSLVIYGSEKGAGATVNGFEFIETIITEPINDESKLLLNPSQNINCDTANDKNTLISRVVEMRAKYNEKDGKK